MTRRPTSVSRRQFMTRSAATAAALASPMITNRVLGANDKLQIACVGVGGRGHADLMGVAHERIVALCDVDAKSLDKACEQFGNAARFRDFRIMLDKMHADIDAVVVGTPDHMHAPITLRAMREHKHVFCEKPLTHDVHEARQVALEAAATKAVTQMGTQIHAGNNYRRVVEAIRAGAIGKVQHVHTWVPTSYHGGARPTATPPVPPTVDWDLWIGAAPYRPYHPAYHPFHWRGWWDFGGGALADMACHHVDLPFWALGIRRPNHVSAQGPEVHPESPGQWNIVDYVFPAIETDYCAAEVKLTWYHGGKTPPPLAELPDNIKYNAGNIFVGSEGTLIADYGKHHLLPIEKFRDYTPPEPTIAPSIGHHREWTEAVKANDPDAPLCNFQYAGPLTEAVLLGNVAFRTGKALEWDAARLRATNAPEAMKYLWRSYRRGWEM